MKSISICVTDKYSNLDSEKKNTLIFVWDEFTNGNKFISVPNLVEKKAKKYRSEFLDWVHLFSQTKINGKTLYNHLEFEDGFPFWWATSLGQKFNIQDNSQINDAIKSMAFYDYLNEKKIKPSLVEVYSKKKGLINFFKTFQKEKNLKIKFIEKNNTEKRVKSVFFYAIYLLRFVVYQLFQKQAKRFNQVDFIFFDIFTHLKEGKEFKSNYWTKLVDLVKNKTVIWNHIYFKSEKKFSYLNSLRRIKLFNRSNKLQYHRLLEQNFGFKSYLKTLKLFFRIKKKGIEILPLLTNSFTCKKRGIDLSSWVKDDFFNSIIGQEALKNCYYNLVIKNVVECSPPNVRAFFIQEFQPWEIALVYYWRKTKQKKIIGIPHSTHRYWDLRYFFSKSFFPLFSKDIFPDQIGVNGKYSYNRCLENGYPKKFLKPLEALRYIHHPVKPIKRKNSNRRLVILICCDYQLKTSEKLIKIVNQFLKLEKIKHDLKIRMHPSFPIPSKLLKKYRITVNNEEIIPALQKSDWVITSNLSAIAVDAFYQGCKVGQLSDGIYFNLSPLRGVVDHLLFTDSYELKKIIKKEQESKVIFEYFFIDQNLRLWKNLLFDDEA